MFDRKFTEIVAPYAYGADLFAASCDQRLVDLAKKQLNNNRYVDHDMIWQVADEYRVHRNDILDYACSLSMRHELDVELEVYKQDNAKDHSV